MKCSLATLLLMLFLAINPLARKMKRRKNIKLISENTTLGAGSFGVVELYSFQNMKIAVKFLNRELKKENTYYDNLFLTELLNFTRFCWTGLFPKVKFPGNCVIEEMKNLFCSIFGNKPDTAPTFFRVTVDEKNNLKQETVNSQDLNSFKENFEKEQKDCITTKLFSFGIYENKYFFAMQQMTTDFLKFYKNNSQHWDSILYQVAVKVDKMHRLGFIHRDIKPENIFINLEAGKPVAYLGDLGFVIPALGSLELKKSGSINYAPTETKNEFLLNTVHQDYYAIAKLYYLLRYKNSENLEKSEKELEPTINYLLSVNQSNPTEKVDVKVFEKHSKCFQELVNHLHGKANIEGKIYQIATKDLIPIKPNEKLNLDTSFKASITIQKD